MANLKDLKLQINSVGSTKKITSAMKMVAASKLRRAQEKAESARPYSSRLEEMLNSLASSRSEEHTSELQSLVNLVCRLLLEKKNTTIT